MRTTAVLLSNFKSLSSIHIRASRLTFASLDSIPISIQYRSSEILRGEEATIFRFPDTILVSPPPLDPFIPFCVPAIVPSICIPVPGIGWKPVVPTKFQESANQTFLDGCSAHSVPSRPLSRGKEGGGKPCAGSRVRERRERENSFDHRNFAYRGRTRSNIQFRVRFKIDSLPRPPDRTLPPPLCKRDRKSNFPRRQKERLKDL